jgi:hypothetical protein
LGSAVIETAFISFGSLAVLLVARGIWKDVRRSQRRRQGVSVAASSLPRGEQVEWFNRTGRYKAPGAIPRNLGLEYMTRDEIARFINRVGEFAD